MDLKLKDIAEYLVIFVSEFSKKYKMNNTSAFNYLRQFKAIEFLIKYYNYAHTQSFDTIIDEISSYCKRNGGQLA